MDSPERLVNRLKLSDLRLLRAVVDHGGMGKAAQHVNLTQPAVSKAIAAMERLLGVRLLDRDRRGVTPTLYGEALLQGGLAAFDELRQSLTRIKHLADPNSGMLRIGCSQPLALGFVPSVIERIRQRYPGIRFHFVEGEIMSHLRQRSIELALGRSSPDALGSDVNEELLFDDPLLVAAAADNPWARRRTITLKDISGGPWAIPYYDTRVGRLIIEAFEADGLEPPIPYVSTVSLTLQLGLLATGPTLTITASSMLRLNAKRLSLKILPVLLRHRPSPVAIVTLKNRTLSPLAELFIKYARDAAKPFMKKVPNDALRRR